MLTTRSSEHFEMSLDIHAGDPVHPIPSGRSIIGLVSFKDHRGNRAEAILDAEGRWRCPTLPVLDRVLNILFEPKRGEGAGRPYGHDELGRVARWIRGNVESPSNGA